jgi:hypothetical protein
MGHKNKSFLRRLFNWNAKSDDESVATVAGKGFVCRPADKDPSKFCRYRWEGGDLVPVDSTTYDSLESCMNPNANIA